MVIYIWKLYILTKTSKHVENLPLKLNSVDGLQLKTWNPGVSCPTEKTLLNIGASAYNRTMII